MLVCFRARSDGLGAEIAMWREGEVRLCGGEQGVGVEPGHGGGGGGDSWGDEG
jgi:hypothetical protein